MNQSTSGSSATVDWGVAARALAGGPVSGDMFVVIPLPTSLLFGVVDGLGHGPAAHVAAELAIVTLKHHAGESLSVLLSRCHEKLTPTRGAVMSLASIDLTTGTLTWLGVGNVEGCLLRDAPTPRKKRESLSLRGGVVGLHLPTLHPATVMLDDGDMLTLTTDGIRSGFHQGVRMFGGPQQLADRILADYSRTTDDALVLVARYRHARERSATGQA